MSLSFWQIMVVAVLILLLFGRGKVPQLLTDIAQGIKNFKAGIRDGESDGAESKSSASISHANDVENRTEATAATKSEA